MLYTEKKYSYNDIAIIPQEVSRISSRKECEPFIEGTLGTSQPLLPVFTAPMSSIVNADNYKAFKEAGVTPIIPRSVSWAMRLELMQQGEWVAMGLEEFDREIVSGKSVGDMFCNICLDIANGHMHSMLAKVRDVKDKYPNVTIMTGNIANPATILPYCFARVDYVRVGIGAGAGCITSSNTGIHYPMASLIDETNKELKVFLNYRSKEKYGTKIIADGGIRNYADVIKALALGADYVMAGGIFAQCEEACGKVIERDGRRYHVFYGMASARGQRDLYGKKTKTSEGIVKEVEIKYTLSQWAQNMQDYLRSAMSYCSARNLKEFSKKAHCVVISENTKQSINQ